MLTASPISGAVSCHGRCSVVGFSSKRLFPPLTVARSHSAPSLHGHYPFHRYYGLSDSRAPQKKSAGLPGSCSLFPHAPPPNTPESPVAALIRFSATGGRLHPIWETGHSPLS